MDGKQIFQHSTPISTFMYLPKCHDADTNWIQYFIYTFLCCSIFMVINDRHFMISRIMAGITFMHHNHFLLRKIIFLSFLRNLSFNGMTISCVKDWNVLQGVSKVFRHLKWAVCGELVHLKIFLRKYQMKKSIIPTLSENSNEIRQTWHRLQPLTWSEVNL